MRRFVLILPEGELQLAATERQPVRVVGLPRLQELLATTHIGWEAYEKIPVLPTTPHADESNHVHVEHEGGLKSGK